MRVHPALSVLVVLALGSAGCASDGGADGSGPEAAAPEDPDASGAGDATTEEPATDAGDADEGDEPDATSGGDGTALLTVDADMWTFTITDCWVTEDRTPPVQFQGEASTSDGDWSLRVTRSNAVVGDGTNDDIELYRDDEIFARATQPPGMEGSEELFAVAGQTIQGAGIDFRYEDDGDPTRRVPGDIEASC